jgi:hypothetical protein
MHARGHEGETLEQTLDVGIGRTVLIEKETAGYARILARKFSTHLTKVGEFAFIVFE